MTSSRKARLRWGVPVVVAAATAGAVVVSSMSSASAAPEDLSPKTAQELLTDLAAPTTDAFSGTVTEVANLGLPELPGAAGEDLGPMTLATGTNTIKVWADGPERSRVALTGQLAEYDVVRSGADVWTYSNSTQEVSHLTLPDASAARPAQPLGADAAITPADAARTALDAIDPSTDVEVAPAVTVAGRAARQLVLTPKDSGSLVASVRMAVDAETSVPLRVQVFSTADDSSPAFEVGFTDVDFTAPDAGVFDFTPPEGAQVTEVPVPTLPKPDGRAPQARTSDVEPVVTGTGWATVAEMPAEGAAAALADPQLQQLTTVVPQGRVFSTALFSVLLTDDGRVLAGAVPPQTLQDAA